MSNWEYVILKFSRSNKKMLCVSVVISFLLNFVLCVSAKDYSDKIQNRLANKIMRLHVLANSDLNYDQDLKLKVRDEILNRFDKYLYNSKTKIQAKEILSKNLSEIKKIAREIISKNGFDYNVQAMICHDNFPTKTYGDITLPAGNYETLKIIIGKGQGHNWWCVMFPPLCFIDATRKTNSKNISKISKQKLKNLLSDDEYKIINYKNEKSMPIKIKFKIVEASQKLEQKSKFAKKN